MEKTGLINKLFDTISVLDLAHDNVSKSKEAVQENKALSKLHSELKNIGSSKDIDNILSSERYLLRMELNRCPNDDTHKATRSSLSTAIKDLDQAAEMIQMVKNLNEYAIFNKGISQKDIDRKNGLPRDAFHRFVDSNKTRLGNRIISADASEFQRKVLIERHSHMGILKKEYMKLQANALDIKLPEKSKERER